VRDGDEEDKGTGRGGKCGSEKRHVRRVMRWRGGVTVDDYSAGRRHREICRRMNSDRFVVTSAARQPKLHAGDVLQQPSLGQRTADTSMECAFVLQQYDDASDDGQRCML